MTLGRTADNVIKIKTDEAGTPRAVNCACCGGCACGSAAPIKPPGDPDFLKKLRGDDPSVVPFTQVSVTYSVTVYNTASGIMTGTWEDGSGCHGAPKKIFVGQGCSWGGCGYCAMPEPDYSAIGAVDIALLSDGCLSVKLIEEYMLEGIKLAGAGENIDGYGTTIADCSVDDGTGTITIQGVAYPTVRVDVFGSPISGALDITFS